MSTIRNPVGPQSSRVYWRRRLVALLGLVAVILVVVLIVVRPGSGDETPDPSTTSTPPTDDATTDEPADTEPDPNADPTACTAGSVTVTPVTDKDVYAPGELPLLSLTLTNTGAAACTINAGSDMQEYRITSGADPIWNSRDCQVDAVPAPVELVPGEPQTTAPFAWDRTRSDPATCEAERVEVTGGGATYRLAVVVDGIESASDKPFLLN